MDRQRMLTIFGAAWISAALLTWFLYARTKAPQQEKTVKVVAALRDLPAGHKVTKEDLKLVTVQEKDVPRGAATSPNELIGRALLYPMSANEAVSTTRVTLLSGAEGAAAILQPGKRAMSVPFTDASGAAGLIQPQSHVDVLFTRTGNAIEAMTVTVLEDIEVLSVGTRTQVDPQVPGTTTKTGVTGGQNRTATLVLTPEQAQKLELAKNQGKISLSLRNPMDRSTRIEQSPSTMEQIDPLLLARSGQGGRRGLRLPGGNPKDAKAWAALIGEEEPKPAAPPKPPVEKKEPPKPRAVVDVYRGDKHVQEIFQ